MKTTSESFQGRLTAKQENFCIEYARTGNAVKSYISAYEKNNSYSAAGVEAHRLLKNPKIKGRLKELYETHNAEKIMQAEVSPSRKNGQKNLIKKRVKAIFQNYFQYRGATTLMMHNRKTVQYHVFCTLL